jgi:glutamyl-Q tRNA(Asp) synthetase
VGAWLVRIEDVDTPRTIPGADQTILHQLTICGLQPDAPPTWQSQRTDLYQSALTQLQASGMVYPCACSRKDIADTWTALGAQRPRNSDLVYPGTCRNAAHVKSPFAWRIRTSLDHRSAQVDWHDRRLGPQSQDIETAVGDFVVQRADECFTYQLAVVVDDAEQGISHVVRGEDLADNTARQIWLQGCLNVPTPQYLHTPLVLGPNGEKLSKQNGATALDITQPLQTLNHAASVLGLAPCEGSVAEALLAWTQQWPFSKA